MTEDLLVGIRVGYRQKKIEFEEKFLNAAGSGGVPAFGKARNPALKS
jgi:hypothetical protein